MIVQKNAAFSISVSQNSGFAVEALAGLASKENFSKVELRKTESFGAGSPGGLRRLEPYLPLMLIHIKGKGVCMQQPFLTLPNDNILDWAKFKSFADDKIYVAKKLKFLMGMVENNLGKGENAG